MNSERASVIVCSFSSDRYPRLVAAVDSVRGQTRAADELIVVIDHNPELAARVRERFPDVVTVESSGPPGLSGARNTGTATATGEIVVYLDDDAVAEPGWLAALTAHYARPDVLGVGGAAVPDWEVGRPRWWPDEFDWVIGCSYRGLPTSAAPVRNLMGCSMSLRRRVVDAVGGFDGALGRTASGAAGCEETELCIRAAERFPHGVFLHEPVAVVRHHVPAARGTFGYFRSRCRAEGVSKRLVTNRAGADVGLSAERAYVRRVLPAGILRNVSAAVRGDAAGVLRATAIAAGVATTTTGFLSVRPGSSGAAAAERLPAVEPVLPLVIDVAEPPRTLPLRSDAGRFGHASCLVLDCGVPVGAGEIALDGTEATTADVLARLDESLGVDSRRPAGSGPVAGDDDYRVDRPGHGDPVRVLRDVTVAIATHGRPESLAGCLASIAAGTALPRQIVVADNAPSDDRTEAMIARYRAEGCAVEYVREDRRGLAHAHNAALDLVATEFVAFTDDDVWVHERWLENISRGFDADPEVVCVTGLIAPRELDTLPQQWVEGQGLYSKGLRSRVFDNRSHRTEDPMFPITAGAFGSGANMAFRSRYLREHGGFDGALGAGTVAMGGDDLAAFYDVIRRGYRLAYEPSAIVLHPHHRDYAALRRQVYGYGAGLGAHLMRCVLAEPRAAVTILRHHRTAAARLDTILHPQPAGLPAYPRDLSRAQRNGMISGPARYLISAYRARRGETT